jgi:uncharacterized protein (DUF362 family)
MNKLTRRSFLRRATGAGLALSASELLTGCGGTAPPFVPSPTDTPVDTTARVAAIRGTDLREMTHQGLEAVGGIESVVHPGETVFIKPNLGGVDFVSHNSFLGGESTKIEIIVTVAEECLQAGAAKVIIGEGGQVRQFSWEHALTLDGSTTLAAEAVRLNAAYADRLQLACLMVDSPEWDPLPSPHTDLGDIYVSSLLARADRVISIAPIKTHRWTHITATMKNFVGSTSFDQYGGGMPWRYALHGAAGGVSQCFLDIVAGLRPDLAIIDGSICCEGNGPHVLPMWGTTIDVRDHLGDWFLLAGTDLPALDATAARIIGQDVGGVPYLLNAYDQGLGQIQESRIQLVGASLDELRMNWTPAQHLEGFGDVILPTLLLNALGLW